MAFFFGESCVKKYLRLDLKKRFKSLSQERKIIMEIWVDHYYADHLKEGALLYAPYIQSGAYDIEEVQKINDIADRLVGLQFLFEDAYRERTGEGNLIGKLKAWSMMQLNCQSSLGNSFAQI